MNKITVSAIVAMAENDCIGKDNDLPWHIPADLKRFKALTMGKPIIMGRKTFESIFMRLGKPLPGRISIIVSRSGYAAEGAITCPSLESAIAKAKEIAAQQNLDEIFIGGGGEIFTQGLPYTDRIYLTRVHLVVNGDAFFSFGSDWQEKEREDHEGDPAFSYILLEKPA